MSEKKFASQADLEAKQISFVELGEGAYAYTATGKPLSECYRETYARLQPQFGHWVIFDHCMPFDVSRACDAASGIGDPRIWTAERDKEMWAALET
jgi:hypothetical protein